MMDLVNRIWSGKTCAWADGFDTTRMSVIMNDRTLNDLVIESSARVFDADIFRRSERQVFGLPIVVDNAMADAAIRLRYEVVC